MVLKEYERKRKFRVVEDDILKMPKKVSKMIHECRIDEDNETTDSLIERAICKQMENLCFNLKKLNPEAKNYEFYFQRKDISEFTSEHSTSSRIRKYSCDDSRQRKKDRRRNPPLRTKSLRVRKTEKKEKPAMRKSNSIGRLQKICKQKLANLT